MRLFTLLVALSFASSAWAQFSLQSYRDSVLMRSNEILASQARTAISQADQKRAKSDFLPSLRADGSFSTDFRHSSDDKQWGFALTPAVSQTIYGGGAVRAAYRQAELRLLSSRENERQTWFDVRYVADLAYWGLSAMQLYMGATNEYVSIISSLHSVVQERYREGYIAKSDMLQVEARLSQARYSLIEARNDYDVALHRFNNLLDREPIADAEQDLANSIIDSIAMPRRIGVEELFARRSDLRSASLSVDIAREGVVASRATFNPTLSAAVSGLWQTFSPNTSGHTYLDGALVVRLSVPIFHWSERRHSVSAARARVSVAQTDFMELQRNVALEEADGWSALTSSYSQMQSSLHNLSIASENLSISTYSYSEGQATVLDVLQAQISWIQIYTNAITARYNYAVAVSNYLRLTEQ